MRKLPQVVRNSFVKLEHTLPQSQKGPVIRHYRHHTTNYSTLQSQALQS